MVQMIAPFGGLSVPIRDAAGKLNEVVGPVTVSASGDFDELEASLQNVAGQIGTVVERLQHSQREVLRSEQLAAVGQMAAGLAHELRNPLTSMKVLVQPAAEPAAAVSLSEEDLAVLNEEIARLERSIQTFLDFARPPQPEKRPFEARGVLEQVVHLVSGRADRQGVRITCAEAAGGWFTVRVAATGIGLPAHLGQRIFEPFVSTKETGMGLGMSICKRIVEAHGGEIIAAGRPGGGTTFTVRLPLRTGPGAATGQRGGVPCPSC
jgi:signal transduction histidine kinase